MPQATKIVVHFDDGSTYEVDPSTVGSIFMNEPKAKKCGHNPPYGKPPQKTTESTLSMSSTETADDAEPAGTCYLVNGIIFCP